MRSRRSCLLPGAYTKYWSKRMRDITKFFWLMPQLLIYSVKVTYHKYNHVMNISRNFPQHSFEIPGCQHFPNPFKCKLSQKMRSLPGVFRFKTQKLERKCDMFWKHMLRLLIKYICILLGGLFFGCYFSHS